MIIFKEHGIYYLSDATAWQDLLDRMERLLAIIRARKAAKGR